MDTSSRREYLLGIAHGFPEIRAIKEVEALPDWLQGSGDPLTPDDLVVINSFTDEEISTAEGKVLEQFKHIRQYGM
ncbi:MAG TPA: hypothetical protein VJJ24_02110 [Candidatus Paceibacterota bacterium]